jgi:predicted amidohydrolase
MTDSFKVACVQTNSGADVDANVAAAVALGREAVDAGADLIAFPEAVNVMEANKAALREKIGPEDSSAALASFRDLARETAAWVLVGSMIVEGPGGPGGKMANRSLLIDGGGEIKARYDKIHMFDADLGGSERHRESANFAPGGKAVVAGTPWGGLGMTVCYDLRFPGLYRTLAQGGAKFISVPSAFTRLTGEAHWHVLLRARAIENGCYVFAPAQCGDHDGGRRTFGHSLIVDPWGGVLADGGQDPGYAIADIDPAKVVEARAMIPSLIYDRPFT